MGLGISPPSPKGIPNSNHFLDRFSIFLLKKRANPGLVLLIFVLFKHQFYRKNCRLQQDSNSDRRSRRLARWQIDHCHGASYPHLCSFHFLCFTFRVSISLSALTLLFSFFLSLSHSLLNFFNLFHRHRCSFHSLSFSWFLLHRS